MTFDDLKLTEPLLRAVKAEGYTSPTPIQAQAIPHVLAGKDLLGCAQTGTGKTAAFALPILQRLSTTPAAAPAHGKARPIRALILTPTRELASQIGESFATYGKHTNVSCAVVFGGVGQDAQEKMLRRGVDVLVACPGRLLDLMQQGFVSYAGLEVFVLDEADRMLDMGFIHDVKRVIAALPKKRQTLFFSATMPPEIQALAGNILVHPEKVAVTPVSSTAETVEQRMYFVEKDAKRSLLVHLLGDKAIRRALVFTRTKHGANRVAQHLEKANITAAAIHGNKSQSARERALTGFKDGDIRVLVATDIAARGIDIEGLSHVINFDLPNIPESYVHRIGRTGRAGASGMALSFCDAEERAYLKDIERTIRRNVPVVADHPYRSSGMPSQSERDEASERQPSRPNGGGGQRHGGQQRSQHAGARDGRGGGEGGGGRNRRRRGGGGQGGRSQGASSGGRSEHGARSSHSGQRGASPAPAVKAAPQAPAARPERPMPKWL